MVTALFFCIDLHQRQAAKDCMSALRWDRTSSFEIISSAINYETLGGAASPSPERPCHPAQFQGTPKELRSDSFGAVVRAQRLLREA
jgi:hypothetical protein